MIYSDHLYRYFKFYEILERLLFKHFNLLFDNDNFYVNKTEMGMNNTRKNLIIFVVAFIFLIIIFIIQPR